MQKRQWQTTFLVSISFPLVACATVAPLQEVSPPRNVVLFLCAYGGAKSVIAASYFNRIAQEEGMPFLGVAAAADTPYDAVPQPVADLLEREGLSVRAFRPRCPRPADFRDAVIVVSIDCDPPAAGLSGCELERWDDVPKLSVDLKASAAAIQRHVQALAAKLRKEE